MYGSNWPRLNLHQKVRAHWPANLLPFFLLKLESDGLSFGGPQFYFTILLLKEIDFSLDIFISGSQMGVDIFG